MQIKDIADRVTILKIKQQHGVDVQKELDEFLAQMPHIDDDLLNELYIANCRVWDLEMEVGQLALEIRDWNNKRNDIKNRIADLYGGHKDVKKFYASDRNNVS